VADRDPPEAPAGPPERIQLRRTKGWRKPDTAIVVARPSRWGNPYVVGDPNVEFTGASLGPGAGFYRPDDPRGCQFSLPPLTAAQAVYLYRADLTDVLADPDPYYDELRAALNELRGHDLACWCPLVDGSGQPVPCHADVLLELTGDAQSSQVVSALRGSRRRRR
jgi:hypothetical protein